MRPDMDAFLQRGHLDANSEVAVVLIEIMLWTWPCTGSSHCLTRRTCPHLPRRVALPCAASQELTTMTDIQLVYSGTIR